MAVEQFKEELCLKLSEMGYNDDLLEFICMLDATPSLCTRVLRSDKMKELKNRRKSELKIRAGVRAEGSEGHAVVGVETPFPCSPPLSPSSPAVLRGLATSRYYEQGSEGRSPVSPGFLERMFHLSPTPLTKSRRLH